MVEKEVIIPEIIPSDLLQPPDCPERDEIKWGDARAASEHYRKCKDLSAQRIRDIKTTVDGRWDWLRNKKKELKQDAIDLKNKIEGNTDVQE